MLGLEVGLAVQTSKALYVVTRLFNMVLLAGGGTVLLGFAYLLFHRASANFVEEL